MHAATSGAPGVRERDPGAENRGGVFPKGRSEEEMGVPHAAQPLGSHWLHRNPNHTGTGLFTAESSQTATVGLSVTLCTLPG